MSGCEWIVCESSGRWAAGLRTAIARRATGPRGKQSLQEVRSLSELSRRIADSPGCISLIEVRLSALYNLLMWLAEARSTDRHARFIALWDPGEDELRDETTAALWAAGVVEILDSPRRLQEILPLAEAPCSAKGIDDAAGQSFTEWAWAALPWQAERRPIG